MTSPSIPLEDLLKHADWVRSLTRSLVRDAARADDIAQEVWLAALRSGPSDDRNLRGWLRTTARRIASRGLRRDQNSTDREQAAANPASLPATEELVARAAVQRDVSRQVLALDEPYRRVILLRYWEGLPPREIAARERLPVATVKTQLQRAQAQLRDRLEDEYGGEGHWCLAIAPLLTGRGMDEMPTAAPDNWALLSGVAVAGIAVLAFVGRGLFAEREPGRNVTSDLTPETTLADSTFDAHPGERRAAERSAPYPVSRSSSEMLMRLVDVDGNPLEGLRLRWHGAHDVSWQGGDPIWIGNDVETLRLSLEEQARLDADQDALFELCAKQQHSAEWSAKLLGTPIPERECTSGISGIVSMPAELAGSHEPWRRIDVVSFGWTLVAAGIAHGEDEIRLIAAPSVKLSGRIQDEQGKPVSGAGVSFEFPDLDDLEPESLEIAGPPTCRSDASGRFVLRAVPAFQGARWAVRSEHHETWDAAVPRTDRDDLTMRLRLLGPLTPRLQGTVFSGTGEAFPGAHVHYGELHTRSELDGSFSLLVPNPQPEARLIIWAPGKRPFIDEDIDSLLVRQPIQRDVILVDGLRELRGQVLDATGSPIAKAEVGLFRPIPIDGTLTSLAARVGERDLTVFTSDDGHFRLTGVSRDRVRVLVCDLAGRRNYVSEALDPAAGLHEIRLPSTASGQTVRGTVHWQGGARPEDITVVAGVDWLRTRSGEGSIYQAGIEVDVANDGSFTLESVPRSNAWIAVRALGDVWSFPVDELQLDQPVLLTVP